MEILDPASALLTNVEVLELVRMHEKAHLEREKELILRRDAKIERRKRVAAQAEQKADGSSQDSSQQHSSQGAKLDNEVVLLRELTQLRVDERVAQRKLHGSFRPGAAFTSVREFLESTPAGTQTCQQVSDALVALASEFASEGTQLTREEMLMCVNWRPTSLVEVHKLIAHAETRFSESQLERICELMAALPEQPDVDTESDSDADTESDDSDNESE
ncbi:MAG: hypothetical protein MHM6MM_000051 [Cercozoa sp. M6MM]